MWPHSCLQNRPIYEWIFYWQNAQYEYVRSSYYCVNPLVFPYILLWLSTILMCITYFSYQLWGICPLLLLCVFQPLMICLLEQGNVLIRDWLCIWCLLFGLVDYWYQWKHVSITFFQCPKHGMISNSYIEMAMASNRPLRGFSIAHFWGTLSQECQFLVND